MIAIVMAGGQGTRMDSKEEKLMLTYKKNIILHVIDALKKSNCFSRIIAAVSPHSPRTKKLLENLGIELFDTPGVGYVEDLFLILKNLDDYALVISGDMPLLDGEIIRGIINQYNKEKIWTSFLVTKKFEKLHKSKYIVTFENQDCFFTGISIINAKNIGKLERVNESYKILDDKRIALNVNTKEDYELLGAT